MSAITLRGCEACQKLKFHLHQHHVIFEKLDIGSYLEARKLAKRLGYGSVPLLINKKWTLVGFFKDKLDNLLASNK